MEQRDNIVGYFRGLLTFKASSHPWTVRLCHAAVRVGQFVAMHHKMVHRRPRPSRLSPVLMPPVDPPGHASYPSGHATQAYLIALVLAEVMPGIAWGQNAGGAKVPMTEAERRQNPLWRIAERVARNREVLGVHYPTDSAAGLDLALHSFGILRHCRLLAEPDSGAFDRARAEWG